MSRVAYTHVQQGFRPYTNPRPLAHLRGLGQLLPGMDIGTAIATDVATSGGGGGGINPNTPTSSWPAMCTWTDYIWPSAQCTAALMAQQEQSVAANAAAVAAYYAARQPGSEVAANAAEGAKEAQVSANANVAQIPSDMAATAIPTPPPFGISWWVWAVGAALLVLER